jgi:hypothetical protein
MSATAKPWPSATSVSFLLVGGDVEQPVGCPEGARRTGGHVPVAHRSRSNPGHQIVGNDPAHRDHGCFQHGNVNELTLAGSSAPNQGGGYGESRGQPADRVSDGIAHAKRSRLGRSGDAHHPRKALDDLIVRGIVAHGPVLAETRYRAVDDRGLPRPKRFIADAQTIHDARAEVFQHHIGTVDQI